MIQKIFMTVFLAFFAIHTCLGASTLDFSKEKSQVQAIENTIKEKKANLPVGATLELNIKDIGENLREKIGADALVYEWNIKGRSSKTGDTLSETFDTPGVKNISLNIFQIRENNSTLLISIPINIFVYNEKISLIIKDGEKNGKLQNFLQTARDNGTLIDTISATEKNIQNLIEKQLKTYEKSKKFITIWGERKFVFDTLTQINTHLKTNISGKKIDIVIISDFNKSFLDGYIKNITAENSSIGKILILDTTTIFQLLGTGSSIDALQKKLDSNSYSYDNNTQKTKISPVLFLSQIVSKLSVSGVSSSDLHVILLFPVLLLLISFIKHFIGLSPIGTMLPLFWGAIAFHFGVFFTLFIILLLLITNRGLAYIVSRYNLLYTPKVSFIFIANYIIFLLGLLLLYRYGLLNVNQNHLIYILVFFIVSEKLITTILSKEFGEYKKSLISTGIVAFVCYLVLMSNTLGNFLIAYPEVLILCLPLAFLIGRFTGLRVTEYLRFSDIIKSESEE